MSADLDALDRGVVDAGMTAAEALALAKALQKRVEEMEKFFSVLQGSRPPAKRPARKPARSSGRHLTVVKPS